jgi:flagellar hook assembly protein FlgD
LTVSKALPVINPVVKPLKIQDDYDGAGENEQASLSVTAEYGLTKDSTVTIVINDSKKTRVKTIANATRILKTEGQAKYEFTWDGTAANGIDQVADGTYTIVYTAVDSLGLKAAMKTQLVTVERNKPVVTLLTTHAKPGTTFTINYNISEAASVLATANFKICSTSTCNADSTNITGATIANATGLKKAGANKFGIKMASTLEPGTYFLFMEVVDGVSKKNEVTVFEFVVDGTAPTVTDIAATNVVGTGSSDISYTITEATDTAKVTVTVRSGATYAKSKVVRTLVNNVTQVDGTYDVEWDGKDSKGKVAPNSSATLKYWIDVVAVDAAGNISTRTVDVSYKEITKSAS